MDRLRQRVNKWTKGSASTTTATSVVGIELSDGCGKGCTGGSKSCGINSSVWCIGNWSDWRIGVGDLKSKTLLLKSGKMELTGLVAMVGARRTIVRNDEGWCMRKIVLKHVGLTKPVSLKVITRLKSDYEGIQ
jgi:hypothetical protein